MALTIGQVARQADVGVETIRFYERKGLLEEPPRTSSGYRQYPEETAVRIRFIRRCRDLGFTLTEVGELLALRVDSDTSMGEVKKRVDAKISSIEERMQDLGRMKNALQKLSTSCCDRGPISACPILEALQR